MLDSDLDFGDFLPWLLMLAPGGVGFALAFSGQPVWASLSFTVGTLAILSFFLPPVILFFRNPTGQRTDSIVFSYDAWDAWGRVLWKRQALVNWYAHEALWEQWYGAYSAYQPVDDEILNWYGEDAYRVAAEVAVLRRKHHDAATVLRLFFYMEVTDFDRMLEYLAVLEPGDALAAITQDIPLEYATAMALPTHDHD